MNLCNKVKNNEQKKMWKDKHNLNQHLELEIDQIQLKITLNEWWIFKLEWLHPSFHGSAQKKNTNVKTS
jgi:hypothetical protein